MLSRQSHSLDQSPLYKLRSKSKLARLLRITESDLRGLTKGDNGAVRPMRTNLRYAEVDL